MTVPTRFRPDRMFAPQALDLSGADTALGQRVLSHLRDGGFPGEIGTDIRPAAHPDLAILADLPEAVPRALASHARRGAAGAVVLSAVPDLAAHAKAAGIRVLGPYAFGILLPGQRLNASLLPRLPPPGGIALVAQSASFAQSVIDWAVPAGIGFSRIVGIGGNADIGFAQVLDHLARDPRTKAILLEIGRLRDPGVFLSAARAAARLRPVVALVPGARLRDPAGYARAAVAAAFARAGVLLTETFGAFLAAAETLTRAKPARAETLGILSNSRAAARLAADHALAMGLHLAMPDEPARRRLAEILGADVPPSGLLVTPREDPARLLALATRLGETPAGGILAVHTPVGPEDETLIDGLIAVAGQLTMPLLIAALGGEAGERHRQRLAAAGLACFDTPEAAIDGFRHLLRNRANRAAARELPASRTLRTAPDLARARAALAAARGSGDLLVQDEALAVAAAYNIPVVPGGRAATAEEAAVIAGDIGFPVVVKLAHPQLPTSQIPGSVTLDLPDARAVYEAARAMSARVTTRAPDRPQSGFLVQRQAPRGEILRIRVADDAILGPVIGFGPGGGDPEDLSALSLELPPLNLTLAQALIARSAAAPRLAAHRGIPAADGEAVAATLVRVSQLIVDLPDILLLDLDPIFANQDGVVAASGRILLRPPGAARPPLVISPYPAELVTRYQSRDGESFTLRPIRPEDADAHAALFARLPAEDVRFRFFSPLVRLPPEQITRMTDIDYRREMAMIGVRENGETAGVARLVRNDSDGATAEFAVLVDPAARGKGLATRLMQAIIDWGRAQSVSEISGQILAENTHMLGFVRRLGFELHRNPDEPEIMEAILTL